MTNDQTTATTTMTSEARPAARPYATVSLVTLALGLAVVAIGAYLIWAWLRDPDGHTGRRLITGVLAVVVGGAALFLSVRRACSACRRALVTFRFRSTAGARAAIVQALASGDAEGAGRLLHQARNDDASAGTGGDGHGGGVSAGQSNAGKHWHALMYCQGCHGLLVIDGGDASGSSASRQVVTGKPAMSVVPMLEALGREARGDA